MKERKSQGICTVPVKAAKKGQKDKCERKIMCVCEREGKIERKND